MKVPTLSGEVAITTIGTQNNRLLRLSGRGMPKVKAGGNGDQYVRLIGQFPAESIRQGEDIVQGACRTKERKKLLTTATPHLLERFTGEEHHLTILGETCD